MPVSESVVKNLILKSTPKTFDPIPTPLLLECLNNLFPSLTALVNFSLSSGVFPEVFKTALKKKSLDQNELKNHRPVSNLSLVSKITEKLVLSQLSVTTSLPTISTTAFSLPTDPDTVPKLHFLKSSMIFSSPWIMEMFLCLLFWTCQQPLT